MQDKPKTELNQLTKLKLLRFQITAQQKGKKM